MNQTRVLPIIAGLVAFTPTGLSAATVGVFASNCGANPIVAAGSTPYNGSITPDPSVHNCEIYFYPPGYPKTPFQVVVDGTTGDHVAPICTAQIQGPRTKWSVLVTAAGISFSWGDVPANPVPPQWISWICEYPWTPD